MTRSTPTVIRVAESEHGSSVVAAIIESGKPGITRMVTITAAVGFLLAALVRDGWTVGELVASAFGAVVGTALASAGANVLNMWLEAESDAKMHRTRGRPIPTGRLSPKESMKAGVWLSVVGVVIAMLFAGTAAALICLVCVVSYVLVYTPMKSRTVFNTLAGTIPGALPPMIGAAAASDRVGADALASPLGWSLVALMVIWQIPHFLAIAWVHREDYARGGQRMLPVIDTKGVATSIVIVVTSLLLIPASVLVVRADPLLGWPSLAIAVATGLAYLALCVRLGAVRTDAAARLVFIASIIHLPLLLVTFVVEAGVRVLF